MADNQINFEFTSSGLPAIKKGVEGLRSDLEAAGVASDVFEKNLKAISDGAIKMGRDARKALAEVNGELTQQGSKWQQLQKEIKKANGDYRAFQRNQASGGTERRAQPFGNFSIASLQQYSQATKATSANIVKEYDSLVARISSAEKEIEAAQKANLSNERVSNVERQKIATNQLAESSRRLAEAQRAVQAANRMPDTGAKLQAQAKATEQLAKATRDAGEAQREFNAASDAAEGIISQRYAIYDIANTLGVVSAALLGVAGYAIKVGADFESAFTNVERTLEPGTKKVEELRTELVNLSLQIPLTFQEISAIATLGNQLGVASNEVAGFTETVAKFSSISGVSVEQTATAFGRFRNLLGVPIENFENLASSIALVGVNSAANEAQIISVATEISGVAGAAGLGAQEVVGLAGALASLAIAPEQARGVLQQVFERINIAVGKSGEELTNFSIITGIAEEKLASLVRSGSGGEVFGAFLEGIAELDNVQVSQALDALGLAGIRTNSVISKLTGDLGLYNSTQKDALEGFLSGAELNRQYSLTVQDLNSQWVIFINGINALIDSVTGGAVPGIARLVQIVNDAIFAFKGFLENDFNRRVFLAVGIIIALTGVIGAVASVALIARGAMLAYTLVQVQAARAAGVQRISNAQLIGSFLGVRRSADVATAGLARFRVALARSGIGLAVVALGYLGSLALEGLAPISGAADDASMSMEQLAAMNDMARRSAEGGTDALNGLGDSAQGAGNQASDAAKKLRLLTDYASDLSGVLSRSFELRFGRQEALDKVASNWANLNKEIKDYQAEVSSLTADRSLNEYFLSVAEAYGDTLKAGQLRGKLAGIENKLSAAQQKSSRALTGTSEAAINNRSTIRGLVGDYQSYISSLASSGYTQEQIAVEVAKSRKEFIAQATQLGYNRKELKTYIASFNGMATIASKVPRDISIGFNSDPAQQALNEFFAKAQTDAGVAGGGAGGNYSGGFGDGIDLGLDNYDYLENLDPAGGKSKKDGKTKGKIWSDGFLDGFWESLGMGGVREDFNTWINELIPGFSANGAKFGRAIDEAIADGLATGDKTSGAVADLPKSAGFNSLKSTAEALGRTSGEATRREFRNTSKIPETVEEEISKSQAGADRQSSSVAGKTGRLFSQSLAGSMDKTVIQKNIDGQKTSSQKSGSSVGRFSAIGVNSGLNSNLNIAGTVSSKTRAAKSPAQVNATTIGDAIGSNIKTGISLALNALLGGSQTPPRIILRNLIGYAEGGYTGAGGKYQPAGIVHKGEYVIPKRYVNQSTGTPDMNYVSRISKSKPARSASYANGGLVGSSTMMVSLSPEDRGLLRAVGGSGDIVLYANNEAIARSANAGNRNIVASGGRP